MVLALALSACTALRFGYNQAPELAFWWLGGYVDFNADQKHDAKERIASWFRWHRQTQLPDYARQVEALRQQAEAPATAEQACQWYETGLARLNTAIDQGLPPVAELALTLTPEQLQNIERKYAKTNKEFVNDRMQANPEARRKAALKRVVERTEQFYGRLSDAQRERIAELMAQSPYSAETELLERKARQQDLLAVLKKVSTEHPPVAQVQAQLRGWVDRWQRSPREAHRTYQQRLLKYNCGFVAQVHNLATPEQRQQLSKRLQGWQEDFRALIAAAAPA